VVIENQFGPTDHTHLGQIMTYLAGQDGPATVVWIAERFREEHRAVVDWLNANTPSTANFFAAELEVVKIASSPPAPWFNVVAKPNDWSRGVKQATQVASDTASTPDEVFNIEYWQAFAEFLAANNAQYKFKQPNKWRYAYIALLPSIMNANAWIKPNGGANKAGLQVDVWVTKAAFAKLLTERGAIETNFGETLAWEERPDAKGSRIVATNKTLSCEDRATWPEQFKWLLDHLDRMRSAILPRVRALSEATE
jgi:hypothetical protein